MYEGGRGLRHGEIVSVLERYCVEFVGLGSCGRRRLGLGAISEWVMINLGARLGAVSIRVEI